MSRTIFSMPASRDARASADSAATTVFFDGACPLCRREIAFYRRQRGACAIAWVDAARATGPAVAPDLAREQALRRFHVRLSDGTLASGAAAFAALWRALPALRWVGLLARRASVLTVLEALYWTFLQIRPVMQRHGRHASCCAQGAVAPEQQQPPPAQAIRRAAPGATCAQD